MPIVLLYPTTKVNSTGIQQMTTESWPGIREENIYTHTQKRKKNPIKSKEIHSFHSSSKEN